MAILHLYNMITKEQIIEQIQMVIDPDIGIDIWTMGLIYDITIREDVVDILMTLTTPFCPFAPILQDQIRDNIESLGVNHVNIMITFEPPWKPSDELRAMIGV